MIKSRYLIYSFAVVLFSYFYYLTIRTALVSPSYVPSLTFLTIKGYQNGIIGNKWTLQYSLPTISFFAPRAIDKSCTQPINEVLNSDSNFSPPFPNVSSFLSLLFIFNIY